MEEIKTNIIQFGDTNNTDGLQEYIANIDTKELTSFLNEYICDHNHGGKIWKYLLQSFDDSNNSHKKRIEVSKFVLKKIEESDVSVSISNEIIQRFTVELSKFKPNHLIEICNLCVEKIQGGNNLHASWKELMPEILSTLVEKNYLMYNNVQMSGIEFKNQIINSLCLINWSTNIVTLLASMFRDISLTKEEHLHVVTKLSLCMDNLTCQELPAFTYQLLKLCSKQNSRLIFLRLQYYFSYKIYKHLGEDLSPSSDSTNIEEISDASEHDAVQVESTVLYYIHESANLGNNGIKEYLSSLTNMTKAPEFILHPFQLTVLLAISSVSIFEEQALEIIRSCIVRVITADAKKNDTAWFRNITSSTSKTSNVISAVLENSIKERPYVAQGLINLSFVLLSAGAALGMKYIAEAQWQLGTFTLLKLMKKKEEVSKTVIKQLCNKIVVGENDPHLTECLHKLCKNLTLTMSENQDIIIQLTEETLQHPGWSFKFIVDAIMPLIKISPRIRDNLIILLRKSLYSKELEIRKMAVSGYLKLLKCLKVSNLTALSQTNSSSSSNYSFLTQVSIEIHVSKSVSQFSNEAICLEVLIILRRCFMQQAEIRDELYNGLYDAVCMNSELGISVLKMLSNHFSQFFIHDDEVLPPLDFSKIVAKKNNGMILQEPLGHLIYVIGLILTKVKETYDLSDPNITRTTTILDSLCTRMAKCELIHFNLDTGKDLLDDLPESQTDLHILKQTLSVYEALMGYLINSWNIDCENTAQQINSLFQAYSRIIDLTKNLNKPKKGDGKRKSKDETKNKTTQLKKREFKPVPTILNFQTIGKILSLLYEQNVAWTNTAQSNILKVKCEFHRYVLHVILQIVQHLKTSKYIGTTQKKVYFNYCTEIAAILYERIIKRLPYVLDFDVTTAVLGVECFYIILNFIVTYYKEELINFLSQVCSKSKGTDIGDLLFSLIENIHTFFEKDDDDEYFNDSEGKKLPVLMANIYTILVTHLPHQDPKTVQVLEWIKKFTNENIVSNKQVGSAIISVCLNLNIRCKEETSLYENIAIKLCDTIGTINNDKPECPVQLKIINESTALTALSSLAHTLKLMLNEADWIIQRCKAEYSMTIHPVADKIERRQELLKCTERNLCCHICRIVNVCTLLSNMTVPPGANTETVFKLLIHLYITLNSLTKYFLLISSKINPAFQRSRFEQVLKLSGKPLSNMVSSFILYIEQGPEPEEEATQQRKKSSNPNTLKTKILREARHIPKLVYEMEQFGRNVITLSNKTKINLSKYVGLGTSRDFRIKAPALKEILDGVQENLDLSNDNQDTTDVPNAPEEDTSIETEEQEDTSSPEKRSRKM